MMRLTRLEIRGIDARLACPPLRDASGDTRGVLERFKNQFEWRS
jgi:hypothetical protein